MQLPSEPCKPSKPAPGPSSGVSPQSDLGAWSYIRHNQRRLEHLASLNLPIHGASVLEVGAGIGDHTHFFLDRGCRVVTSEGRPENLAILKSRYPKLEAHLLDLDQPQIQFSSRFDVVYCYGLLYHLKNPERALDYMARYTGKILLLETCVSFGDGELLNPIAEPSDKPSQAISGQGCRPTRLWVFNQLKSRFSFVYATATQPNHEEFPLDWTAAPPGPLTRSVFVASRDRIENPLLLDHLPLRQKRH